MNRILIFDDEHLVTDILQDFLKGCGFNVKCLNSAASALSDIREFKPHLILCDLIMEPVGGLEVYYTLKRNLDTSTLPFVFISSRSEKEDILKGLEIGADDYITKPFDLNDLNVRLTYILRKQEHHTGHHLRLLFVESNQIISKKTENELSRDGYTIYTTDRVAEAIKIFNSSPFDVVISGTKLADGSGTTLCQQVKSTNPDVKFFLLLSSGNSDMVAEGVKVGVDEFVYKNLGVDGLKLKLMRLTNVIPRRELVFDLSRKGVLEVLKTCEINGFSGKLTITSPAGTGSILMKRGEFISMTFNQYREAEALDILSTLKSGNIQLEPEELAI